MPETYVYTGRYRAKTLTVKRIDLDTENVYNFLNSFSQGGDVFDAIVDAQLASMSDTDYDARLAAFYVWVETQEPGLDSNSISINSQYAANGIDALNCPVNTVAPVY